MTYCQVARPCSARFLETQVECVPQGQFLQKTQLPLLLRQLRHREVSARHEGLEEIVSNTKPPKTDA